MARGKDGEKGRKRRGGLLRWMAGNAAGLLLALLLLNLVAEIVAGIVLRRDLERRMGESLGGPVGIGGVGVAFWTGRIELRDVVIPHPEPFASAYPDREPMIRIARMVLDPDIGSVFHPTLKLDEVRIHDPAIEVILDPSGETNLGTWIDAIPSREERPEEATYHLHEVTVDGGRFAYHDYAYESGVHVTFGVVGIRGGGENLHDTPPPKTRGNINVADRPMEGSLSFQGGLVGPGGESRRVFVEGRIGSLFDKIDMAFEGGVSDVPIVWYPVFLREVFEIVPADPAVPPGGVVHLDLHLASRRDRFEDSWIRFRTEGLRAQEWEQLGGIGGQILQEIRVHDGVLDGGVKVSGPVGEPRMSEAGIVWKILLRKLNPLGWITAPFRGGGRDRE